MLYNQDKTEYSLALVAGSYSGEPFTRSSSLILLICDVSIAQLNKILVVLNKKSSFSKIKSSLLSMARKSKSLIQYSVLKPCVWVMLKKQTDFKLSSSSCLIITVWLSLQTQKYYVQTLSLESPEIETGIKTSRTSHCFHRSDCLLKPLSQLTDHSYR